MDQGESGGTGMLIQFLPFLSIYLIFFFALVWSSCSGAALSEMESGGGTKGSLRRCSCI